jgi:hypothetical protein
MPTYPGSSNVWLAHTRSSSMCANPSIMLTSCLLLIPVQVLTSNQSSKAADVYAFGVMCWVSAQGPPAMLFRALEGLGTCMHSMDPSTHSRLFHHSVIL